MQNIDIESITKPIITFSDKAYGQLQLMLENDFTLSGKYFRVVISGKGCDGFTYAVGFTDREDNDLSVRILCETSEQTDLEVIIDPFAAFYLGETYVDYIDDYANDQEGFTVVNRDQTKYHGKFWRKNQELVPPTLQ